GAPAHDGGGNFTPPFPTYTSGHGTIGAALFKMMEDYYGRDQVPFTIATDEFNTITNGKLQPRSYDSFSQAAGENALSRIYLGIHFHFDATAAIHCGDQIADYIFMNKLLPLTGPAPRALNSLNPEVQIQLAIAHEEGGPAKGYNGNSSASLLAPGREGGSGSATVSAGLHNVPPISAVITTPPGSP